VACHGGAGTVLSALAAGVPLLLLPRGAPSQARMSAACASRGVGRQVVWDGTNPDEVAGAVDDVTSDDRFRTAAAAVAREIAAMPEPSTAADTLAAVAGHSSYSS
jgi:UDP:flavonoid glycosyltransferase YjiC (YdhE family)